MFETLFSYPAVLRRHRDGPLAAERAAYLEGLATQGTARGTLLRLTASAWHERSSTGRPITCSTAARSRASPAHEPRSAPPMEGPRDPGGPRSTFGSRRSIFCKTSGGCVPIPRQHRVAMTNSSTTSSPLSGKGHDYPKRPAERGAGRSYGSSYIWSSMTSRSAPSSRATSTPTSSTWLRGGAGRRCARRPRWCARGSHTASVAPG